MKDKESSHSVNTSNHQQGPLARNRATGARPVLVINPPRDRAFGAAAEALLDDGLRSLPGFQQALRLTFPNAVVRARDLSGEVGEMWYVFRDGRWVNGQDGNHHLSDG